ncbi:wall-associated receptor kinase-like 20 [Carex littledalei]|uniref:Wall-associated receptor kinase-like 20 n=1 Tax=Carex littledalei TaxID=544730 RepID=A0A833RCF4_9POAL|nr:wall-associated receptor kinase-like 20 [Carex littledalei]
MQARRVNIFILACLNFPFLLSSQKICPKCGNIEIPYPLSTDPNCGDPDYALACDPSNKNLYFPALNGSSYLVVNIQAPLRRLVVQPAPWLPGTCTTQDMPKSEGIYLNQSLPFNMTSSNTIFLFNCSPRLLISPLNCSASSLCHKYLGGLARVDPKEQAVCLSGPGPCCTFLAGGLPSSYRIRLHASGCRAFRSVLHIDPEKPPSQWTEGLEIQWAPPPQLICQTQSDCPQSSACIREPSDTYKRCHCNKGYYWDASSYNCLHNDVTHHQRRTLHRIFALSTVIGVLGFFALAIVVILIKICHGGEFFVWSNNSGKEQEDLWKTGATSAKMFTWKELRKATNTFSKDRLLGSGGFGEVYKGILKDGTTVAVKSAKVGNLKSTQQILNEVGILSLVNHKNLVRLLGCCVEAPQPLMVYDYIPNGTLFEHLHTRGDRKALNWKMRVKVALQTAEALSYLHSSTQVPIYHRDVKSSNILLDEELNVKVSDFGLSRLVQPGLSHVSTCAQGTLGYLDPEYYRKYQLTDKSDVYSFGVVLLELLTGKKVIDFSRNEDDVSLAEYVKRRARDGEMMATIDESLVGGDGKLDLKSVELFAELALDCLRERKEERRGMTEVAEVLQDISRTVENG